MSHLSVVAQRVSCVRAHQRIAYACALCACARVCGCCIYGIARAIGGAGAFMLVLMLTPVFFFFFSFLRFVLILLHVLHVLTLVLVARLVLTPMMSLWLR